MPTKAEKLLERMRRSLGGWGQDDFRTLYKGFGFEETEGAAIGIISIPSILSCIRQ